MKQWVLCTLITTINMEKKKPMTLFLKPMLHYQYLIHFMKTLLITIIALMTSNAFAAQYIQCEATPEEYADNTKSAIVLPKIEVVVDENLSSPTHLMAWIKEVKFPLYRNFEITLEGNLMKPTSTWIKGGSAMMLTAKLYEINAKGVRKILAQDLAWSNTLSSPKAAEEVKNGAIRTYSKLENYDYISAADRGVKVAKDQLTSVSVTCELVR